MAELLSLTSHSGLDPEKTLAVLATLAVTSPAAKTAGEAMLARRFAPLFPIDLAKKDLDYACLLGATMGTELPVVQGVAEVLACAQRRGLGAEHLTALAKLYP
jgi:3-hydroxyisobutyrate dehydrogenase-like beta-hydroxyacid dehydrogenase